MFDGIKLKIFGVIQFPTYRNYKYFGPNKYFQVLVAKSFWEIVLCNEMTKPSHQEDEILQISTSSIIYYILGRVKVVLFMQSPINTDISGVIGIFSNRRLIMLQKWPLGSVKQVAKSSFQVESSECFQQNLSPTIADSVLGTS